MQEIEEIEKLINEKFPNASEDQKRDLKIFAIDVYKAGMDRAKKIFTK